MIDDWKFVKEVHKFDQLPDDSIPEFVFWGRSNVGKSSLINFIVKKNIAKTSRTPGRTKSLVIFQFKKDFRIIDMPGYGFSKISKTDEVKLDKLLETYFKKRENIKNIFILIDSRHLLKEIDSQIINQLNLITEKKIILIFTKFDKIKSKAEKEKKYIDIEKLKKKLHKNVFNTSIKESSGIVLLKKFLYKSIIR